MQLIREVLSRSFELVHNYSWHYHKLDKRFSINDYLAMANSVFRRDMRYAIMLTLNSFRNTQITATNN